MASINEKLNYINETKSLIKDKLNDLGSEIENETTFREYAEKIEDLYNEWPKINDENTIINLENTKKGKMSLQLKGNTNQFTTTGKNLFDYESFKGQSIEEMNNGVECLKLVGITKTYNFEGEENQRYTFQFRYVSKTHSDIGAFQFLYSDGTDSDIKYTGQMSTAKTIYSATSTANKTVIGVKWNAWNSGNSVYIDKNSFQLEKGTSKTSYEPYTGGIISPNPDYPQNIQVATGNNNINIKGKNIWNELWENGYWSRTTGEKGSGDNYLRCTDYISIEPNVTIYFNKPDEYENYAVIFYNSAKEIVNTGVPTETSSKSFTAPSNAYYFTFYCALTSGTATYNNNIMITYGTVESDYEQYQSQSYPISLGTLELCSLINNEDEIIKKEGLWFKRKRINKVILNGEEQWGTDGTLTETQRFKISTPTYFPNSLGQSYTKHSKSNYFSFIVNYNTDYPHYYFGDSYSFFFMYKMTLNEFKTWVSNHNIIVYYVLQEPEDIQITDNTLITQLNNLEKVMSYNDQTNIFQENDNLPFIINATTLMKNSD